MMTWISRAAVVYGLVLGCLAVQTRWFTPPHPVRLSITPKEFNVAPGDSVQLCMLYWYSDGKARMGRETETVTKCRMEYAALPADQRVP